MYKHILITTDGSENAGLGLEHGLTLASCIGAAVTILTVTPPFPIVAAAMGAGSYTPVAVLEGYDQAQRETAERILEAAAERARHAGVSVTALHVPDATPADAILERAEALGCDLICMASHGRRGLKRMLLGSQATEVVTRSAIPVLVVRA
ncbi:MULTISPECIES: universal stress protein [Paracoccaceae]|uniref:Universal stress protein n=2 Tax=Falsigemmobacter TaxID=2780027 RepID=A0A3S3UBG0_9RHOB|nr:MULTISPECIES: universal stress protein [Paracoccaceae]MBJ2153221.1 universal stress protein [Paracoccus sp. IB05]RRH73805.1 universal stress protein [Falsigemmobacter faecalis]RWY38491.1 universal stress protein [Falsigemmobacter intermedius]